MNKYIVFIKDNEPSVVIKTPLTRELSNELKSKGFAQYSYPIEANNESEAIEKLNKQAGEHLNALSEYSGNIFFYCAIVIFALLLAFIFY